MFDVSHFKHVDSSRGKRCQFSFRWSSNFTWHGRSNVSQIHWIYLIFLSGKRLMKKQRGDPGSWLDKTSLSLSVQSAQIRFLPPKEPVGYNDFLFVETHGELRRTSVFCQSEVQKTFTTVLCSCLNKEMCSSCDKTLYNRRRRGCRRLKACSIFKMGKFHVGFARTQRHEIKAIQLPCEVTPNYSKKKKSLILRRIIGQPWEDDKKGWGQNVPGWKQF